VHDMCKKTTPVTFLGRGISGAIPSPDGKSLAIAGVARNQNAWQVENF